MPTSIDGIELVTDIGGGSSSVDIADGVDSTIKATVFDRPNSNPLAVELVDINGDPIGGIAVTNDGTFAKETGGNLDEIALDTDNLALIKAKTDNLDVALSTRLAPADTLTKVATVDTITNPVTVTGSVTIGAGAAVIGHVITDTGSVTVADTELPAAAALADGASSTPTTPTVGHIPLIVTSAGATQVDRQRAIVNGTNNSGLGIASAGLVGQFDDTSPTVIGENNFGNVRITSNRAIHTNLRTQSGAEVALQSGADQGSTSLAGTSELLTRNVPLQYSSGAILTIPNTSILATLNSCTRNGLISISGVSWTGSINFISGIGNVGGGPGIAVQYYRPTSGNVIFPPILLGSLTAAQHAAYAITGNGISVTYQVGTAGLNELGAQLSGDFTGTVTITARAFEDGELDFTPSLVASAVAPTYTDGSLANPSIDLNGNTRITGAVTTNTVADVLTPDGDAGYSDGDLAKNITQTPDGRVRVVDSGLVSDSRESYIPNDVRSLSLTTDGRLRVSTSPADANLNFFDNLSPYPSINAFGIVESLLEGSPYPF